MKWIAFWLVTGVLVLLTVLCVIAGTRKTDVKKLVMIAVMTAMSIVGRFVFAAIPGFKPVTAIVVITGMYLGWDAGFLCGALTALISNCYFGQGPWTAFQMLLWALIGIGAGLLSGQLQTHKAVLVGYGILAGILYSLIIDVYSTIWMGGYFSPALYLTMVATSLPYTILYAVSNVFFLLVLVAPMGRKLSHAMRCATMSVARKPSANA